MCTETGVPSRSGSDSIGPCRNCEQLQSNHAVTGIVDRMRNGIHENTPHPYLPFASLGDLLRRKNTQIDRLRFENLNMARTLLIRGRTIDGYKRFVHAVASSDLHTRVHKVVSIARSNSMSVHAIVARLDQANARVYSSRTYDEIDYQQAYLLWKLGGQRAADLGSRALGLPSLSATRRKFTSSPIIASATFPTVEEMLENLEIILPPSSLTDANAAYVIEVDELKTEKRFRWDPWTNKILGVCREHGHLCSLEFHSVDEVRILGDLLCAEQVHAATEATVIAISCLSDNHNEYCALPSVISGTCKAEGADAHAVLLARAVEAVRRHLNSRGRLYCVASDGESRCGKALGQLTMACELETTSPIYSLIKPLPLFNCLVGTDDLTCDKDWRHVLKRFRNNLVRTAPLRVNGGTLTRPLIKRHLMDGLNMKSHTADSLLSPNDPQDVVLSFRLLNSIASLPLVASSDSTPIYQRTRRSLALLGRLYSRLLTCYTDISSSLRDQLEQLSAVAHLLMVLYKQDKGGFIPAILYLDAQIMIKNAYMCTAKIMVVRPDGRLWIIQLGTDGLETVFGIVRTMIGSDSNVDQLQLANRVSGATQCSRILHEHPEWDRGPRRLAVPCHQGQADDVSSATDHVNAASWVGDVSVANVVLQTCWYRGRKLAENDLEEFGISLEGLLLGHSDSAASFDVLRPFGDGKVVYLGGLRAEDLPEEQLELPADQQAGSDGAVPRSHGTASSDATHPQPDIEDLTSEEEVRSRRDPSHKVDAWLAVDNTPGATKQHKATFLRLLTDSPESLTEDAPGSTNRLSRIVGFTRYPRSAVIVDSNEEFGRPALGFDDPALTLLHVHGML
ncbi:hypothetical protein K466DRAFT_505593 [Polyporus arcularius HHB13444]|uniref:Uncharacterized protein n=1 Tax=Polyporus arcularius HHB13444 TaxID=1314778 RepID=A0A5C3NSN4_9APHY|nr:hypothetical protein K466DRAFT_505593 [Polyporus arcularius HHB13444]